SAFGHYVIGLYYLCGNETDKNFDLALQNLKLSAQKDCPEADNRIALIYDNGKDTPKDPKLAFTHYERAAKKGFTPAEYNLGLCYYDETGVARNNTEAFRLFEKAAKKGYAAAQHMLARCYYYGYGTTRKRELALRYYEVSALNGYEKAIESIIDILLAEKNYTELENYCLKHRWFKELTEKYLERFEFFKKANEEQYNIYISWLNKAQKAGYKDAESKKLEAQEAFESAKNNPLAKLFKKK
ncbi:MAG: sel1 repeat family protein, partial [Clostridia bacterium]|nr:sel1 repeat family protein [Clostridia bacterium]